MPGEEHRSTSIFDTNLRTTAIGFFLLILLSTTTCWPRPRPRRRPSPCCTNLPMGRTGANPRPA